MSLQEFWTNARNGASFLYPTATVDSPKLDANRIEAMLRRADVWLTPKSVEGFEEEDFWFLSTDERDRLRQCVDDFLVIARQVPPNHPANDKQVEAALPAFQEILGIIRPDRYGDAEALVIGKRVEQCLAERRPEWLTDLRFETDNDATGDPALWVWVEVEDSAAEPEVFARNARHIKQMLKTCLRKIDVQRWPYIRFRTVSEQAQSLAEHSE